jgi:hypothetical protein
MALARASCEGCYYADSQFESSIFAAVFFTPLGGLQRVGPRFEVIET